MKSIKRTLALTLVFCMMLAFVPAASAANEPTLTATGSTVKYYGDPHNQYQVFVNVDNLSGQNKNTLDLSFGETGWEYAAASGYDAYGCTVSSDGTVVLSSDTKGNSSKSFKVTASKDTDSYLINIIVNAQFNVSITGNGSVAVNGSALGTTRSFVEDLGDVTFTLTPGTGKKVVSLTIASSTGSATQTPTVAASEVYSYTLQNARSTTYTVSAVFESDAPTITIGTQPTATTTVTYPVPASTTLSVAATVSDASTPTYTWYSNTTNNTTGGTPVGTGASYTIPTNTAANIYYYYCIVSATGATSVTSNVATVTVNPLANYTTNPGTPSVSATGSSGAVSVSWSASTPAATTYTVTAYNNSTGAVAKTSTGITGTSTTITGLSDTTTYYFTVTAVNASVTNNATSGNSTTVTPYTSSSTSFTVRTGTSSTSSTVGSSVTLTSAKSTGYTASTYSKTLYIHNGSSSTTLSGVSVTLSGSGKNNFDVSYSGTTITGGGTKSFTITPVKGLSKGEYYCTVTVSATGVTSKTFTVYFTVGSSSNSTDTLYVATSSSASSSKAIDEYTFTSKAAGYDDLDPTTFYIINNYGSKLSGIDVSLSSKTNFTLDESDTSSSIASSKTTSFTVVPKTGLKAGTYEVTVTVTNTTTDEDYEIDMTFVVKSGSNSDLYFAEKKNGSSVSKYSFATLDVGYSTTSSTFYLYNDSGSTLKSMSLTLSGTDKSSFTVGSLSSTSISDGSYATFTLAPKAGLTAGTYTATVTAEASNGTDAKLSVTFVVKGGTTYVNPYKDIATTAWYYNDVQRATENNLIDGFTDGTFRPDNNLTIAQAIKLASSLHQMYYNGSVTLTNGSPNWYDSYVTYAKNNGVISGDYADYNAVITREEFVNIFYNAMPSSNYAIINDISADYIPDVRAGDTYYSKIFRFYQAGILNGSDTAGTFNPKSNIKRSEVAAILTRMYDKEERLIY